MNKYLIKVEDFSIKSENNICFIEFSAAKTKNAISLLFSSLMSDVLNINSATNKTIFEDFIKDENIVLVVVRSLVPNIFCSGGHLSDLLGADKQEHLNYGISIRLFCNLLSSISIPSIALLAGNAYGGGVELALAPDFRWSIGDNVNFHFLQTSLGVPGGWGGMIRLSQLCPQLSTKKVNSLFLAQDVLSFQRLCQLSLIDKVFDNESACTKELLKWRDNIFACDDKLKEDFYMRNIVFPSKLEEYDVNFFQKYFLSHNHKKLMEKFFQNKRNK